MSQAVLVLVKAALLARNAGLAEVGIDELLLSIDSDSAVVDTPVSGTCVPVPKHDIALSSAAAAAIASCGNIEAVSVERLRDALVKAKLDQA